MGSEGFIWRAGGVRAHTANPEMLKLWKENDKKSYVTHLNKMVQSKIFDKENNN